MLTMNELQIIIGQVYELKKVLEESSNIYCSFLWFLVPLAAYYGLVAHTKGNSYPHLTSFQPLLDP